MRGFGKYLSAEQRLHSAVCDYLDLAYRQVFYFHPHNEGRRSPYERYLARVLRLRPGLPDLMLPLVRGGYAGLGVELKIKPNKLTENQRQATDRLTAQGWKVEVCYDFDGAKRLLEEYLNAGCHGGA